MTESECDCDIFPDVSVYISFSRKQLMPFTLRVGLLAKLAGTVLFQ